MASPRETATDAFACFAGRLEDSCRLALGDEDYDRFAALVAKDIGWPVGELLKSGRGGECFVHEVYSAGKTLPNIEKLVERISGFAKAVNAHPPGPIASPAPLAP
ncbi:MAG: hypothetical protein IPN03_08805 [Holophagales bacterium]|nr:hypothetical protein [Holophagales bacterium]